MQATQDNAWISKIKMDINLNIPHLHEFVHFWEELQSVNIHYDVEDAILWNLTENGEYTTTSAYKAQLFGSKLTTMNKMVSKIWAPPRIKFFAWLAIQNCL
jgi:hypothetical protein